MTPVDILIVDDDARSTKMMAAALASLGKLRFAKSGAQALQLAREQLPGLILLDAEMPGMNGFQVCRTLKADPSLANVPVIFVTSHSEPDFELAGFDIGAADFIAKPIHAQLVQARVKAQLNLKRLEEELRRISTIDPLTGLANRRSFDGALNREWLRSRRAGDALAVLMIDVDHFKAFNDDLGHQQGDACLQAVAQVLSGATLRPADLAARYGGEEFVILLPETRTAGAAHVARRVLKSVEALDIDHPSSKTARLSISIGVGCYDRDSWTPLEPQSSLQPATPDALTADDLLRAADKALYAAKHAGRAQARLLDVADPNAPTVLLAG
ncbi:MAG TPA: diguanylate cyclase [Polyangiaceae bacterium]|jgi:diguanylate cyclase (GGDEF)-like protein|nr:diguanylate cyclase [Polyangiaceae bacterium]